LSKATDLDAKYRGKAKSDEDFKNLWDDDDFKRIVSLNHEIRGKSNMCMHNIMT